jgi:hypothetical protein
MVKKLKIANDKNEYKECKRMLEDVYEDWIKHYRAKSLGTKVGIIARNAANKSGYFFSRDLYMKQVEDEGAPFDKNEIRLSRDAKEMMKL